MSEDERTRNLIVDATCHEVLKYLEERQARRRVSTITVYGILVSLAIGIGGFLINELLVVRVKSEVSKVVENTILSVKISGEIVRLSNQVAESTRKRLSPSIARRMVKNLELISEYIESPALNAEERKRAEEEIAPIVESAALKLAEVNQIELLEVVENKFRKYFKNSGRITQTMVQVRGRQLIGQAGAPRNWFDSRNNPSRIYSSYQAYVNRAGKTEYAEMYLAFEMIVRHMLKRPDEELMELIDDAKSLQNRDRRFFVHLMVKHARNEIAAKKTSKTDRIAKNFKEFLKKFSTKDKFMKNIFSQVMQKS